MATTAQFQDMLTVPVGKIAKIKLTSLSVQNTTTSSEAYAYTAAIYLIPKDSSTEILLDAYLPPTTSNRSHYTTFPTGRRGNSGSTVNAQSHIGQDSYDGYNPYPAMVNQDQGFLNPEFYMGPEEVLRFMWKQAQGDTNYEFFLRGFYLLEDVTA
jgi:hypothetical protein